MGLIGVLSLPPQRLIRWKKSNEEQSNLLNLKHFIDSLDDEIHQIARQDKTRGKYIINGIDVGEAFDILEQGGKQANVNNKNKLSSMMEELDVSAVRRSRNMLISLLLVVVGTLLWGAASFV